MFHKIFIVTVALLLCMDVFAQISPGRYSITSRHSGLSIDVDSAVSAEGANVMQWEYLGGENQQFDISDLGNGYYSIRPVHTGMSLDVWEWSTEPGGEIRQWTYAGGENQQWSIASLGNGYHTISSALNGLALDVWGWSTENGGDIRQWTPTGEFNQQWSFRSVDTGGGGGGGGYTRGPDPSVSALEAARGPYGVSTITVSSRVSGFGGGTIHYPTGTSGTMGVIAVVPGYISAQSSIRWWGPRIASHGFVVITIDTNSGYDQPNSRATQLNAALSYVIGQSNAGGSPISGMVDASRRGVIGWSMGGGGALKLAADDPSLMAAIPQAPYYSGSSAFSRITTPTLIIACENDSVASVNSHASPFYNRIPSSTNKAFLEINNGSHYCANSGNADEDILGKYGVAWMKRFIDLDSRYSQFLCGPNHAGDSSISEYRQTCPY